MSLPSPLYRLVQVLLLTLFIAVIGAGSAQGHSGSADLTSTNAIHLTGMTLGFEFRDIHTAGNIGGIRIYNQDPLLTTTPTGAAIQLWANNSNFPGQAFIDSGAHNQAAVIFRTAQNGQTIAERMRVTAHGNVRIGTDSPQARLATVDGEICGGNIRSTTGTFLGDTNATLRARGDNSGVILLHTVTGGLARERMRITNDGNVGIGTQAPGQRLTVRGPDAGATVALRVENSSGTPSLLVQDNGIVSIGSLAAATASHVCVNTAAVSTLASCASAAEYVPTLDAGLGPPEAGDLVSIAPALPNPAGDTHAPFVVTKSTTACDGTLLGYITDPDKGADGTKVNEHYLPLAIYGYFPAKVTTENGAIRRGAPITSSSKPGYGMKATHACKVIGYALEDADEEGMVQVFAHLSESSAGQVNALQAQVQALTQAVQQRVSTVSLALEPEPSVGSQELAALREENAAHQECITTLEQQNAAQQDEISDLKARLAALEQRAGTEPATTARMGIALSADLLVSLVLGVVLGAAAVFAADKRRHVQ